MSHILCRINNVMPQQAASVQKNLGLASIKKLGLENDEDEVLHISFSISRFPFTRLWW